MFAPACWNDVKVKHLLGRISELETALRPFARQRPHKNEPGAHGILVPATVADVRAAQQALAKVSFGEEA